MLKLVRNDVFRERSQLAVRRLGTDPDSVDGVWLKARDLGDRVRSYLDA